MSDRIARIFVDSNYRTNIADNHGSFSIALSLPVLVEAGSHLRVEDWSSATPGQRWTFRIVISSFVRWWRVLRTTEF